MKKFDLTQGKVIAVLTTLALPIMGSSLLQFTYNLVDMLWIGGLGSNAVASIGSSSFFISIGYAINSLVVTGSSIKVSHAIGRKDDYDVKKYINSGIFINLITGVIFALSLIFFGRNFIGFLNLNNPFVEKNSYLYLIFNAPIMFFTFFNLFYSKILGSFGNNKVAFNINIVGMILNIVLDPIFIYVLNLDVIGAALATLVANIVIFLLYHRKSMSFLHYDFTISLDYNIIREIINLGLPISMQRVLFTLINIILARIIAKFGSEAIAAQKIGLQIESVTYMVIGGLNGAVGSFTGQNFGANKFKRIIKGYNTALIIGIIYSIVMALLFMFFGKTLIKLFIRENNTIIIAMAYLHAVAFSQVFSCIEMVSNGLFTGIGKPNIPSIISIIFTLLRIPMSLLLIKYIGLNGVWMSISISSILKGMVSYLIYNLKVRKEFKYVENN